MKRANWGRIIFISSESAVQIPTEMIHYGMTKLAQIAVSRGLAEALAGLHYAHELCDYDGSPLGIVHRDVSPQNIIITFDGRVKWNVFSGTGRGAVHSLGGGTCADAGPSSRPAVSRLAAIIGQAVRP